MMVAISVRSMRALQIVRGCSGWTRSSATAVGPPGYSRAVDVPDLVTDQVGLPGSADDVDHTGRRAVDVHLHLVGLEPVQDLADPDLLTLGCQPLHDGSLGDGHARLRDLDRGPAIVAHVQDRSFNRGRRGPGCTRRSWFAPDSGVSPTRTHRGRASTPHPGVRPGPTAGRTGRVTPSMRSPRPGPRTAWRRARRPPDPSSPRWPKWPTCPRAPGSSGRALRR